MFQVRVLWLVLRMGQGNGQQLHIDQVDGPGLRAIIDFMFDQGRKVGYGNYKDLIWVLYLDLDLSCLPPFKMGVAKFIMEICVLVSNLYRYMGFDTSH